MNSQRFKKFKQFMTANIEKGIEKNCQESSNHLKKVLFGAQSVIGNYSKSETS